jgi:hypothetical protein
MHTPASARLEREPSPLTTIFVTVPVALVIAFEEWGWEPLSRLMAWLARLRWIARVESRITRMSPYAALAVLLLPWLLLLPVKICALWLIGSGQMLLGVSVVAVAKILGTAIVARLFALGQPALMRLPWFAHLYVRWTVWKNALLARVRATALWGRARAIALDVRRIWGEWRALLWA